MAKQTIRNLSVRALCKAADGNKTLEYDSYRFSARTFKVRDSVNVKPDDPKTPPYNPTPSS